MLITDFLIGLSTMLLCMIVQVVVAFWNVRYLAGQLAHAPARHGFLAGMRALLVAMLAILLGNFVQIGLWGTLFVFLGEFAEPYEAIYHSAVNFTTLGYGDIVMSKHWKLLGPLEAINGVLMLGMSSAALVVILQHLIRVRLDVLLRHNIQPSGTMTVKPGIRHSAGKDDDSNQWVKTENFLQNRATRTDQ